MPRSNASARKDSKAKSSKKPAGKAVRKPSVKSGAKVAATPAAAPSSRKLKAPTYRHFRLAKAIKHPVKLPSVWHISKTALILLKGHWRLFGGIALVYTILSILLVRGLAITGGEQDPLSGFNGIAEKIAGSILTFTILLGAPTNTANQTTGLYSFLLLVIVSLATVWALRQVLAGAEHVRIRDTFYKGMYPIIPVILVLCVIGLQLFPMVIGATLYFLVASFGIAVLPIEHAVWILLFLLLALLSLYMVTSSLFALYVAALPDMTPMQALRSARQLVRYRRWTVLRKLIFLPIAMLLIAAAIVIPLILTITPVAPWVLFALTMVALPVTHAYLYTLYRELLV
jgi:hypothetical protein